MLHDPSRHESLTDAAWDESIARETLDWIARETSERFSSEKLWPWHAKDVEPGDDVTQPALPLYFGAAGVVWALHYLQDVGATGGTARYSAQLEDIRMRNRKWQTSMGLEEPGAFMMGDTPVLMMAQGEEPTRARAGELERLIAGNIDHPARELMWGSPGTMLAASFLHERFGDESWARLFRDSATRLRSQLEWSQQHQCHYWTQDLYGQRSTYLDAIHGFVATAFVLNRGRHLLDVAHWTEWERLIANTVERTAAREASCANWRTQLSEPTHTQPHLMQYCHGAPGFVICLADFPAGSLDELLLAAGEATWVAGPVAKGSGLCHGTGGNGYAFLKLYRRTGDELWLHRARAFAMHGIHQTRADARRYGQLRYSLWTGDPGFAIYLWDCIRATAAFPTLDVFYPRGSH